VGGGKNIFLKWAELYLGTKQKKRGWTGKIGPIFGTLKLGK
jgi:hypothetical protein